MGATNGGGMGKPTSKSTKATWIAYAKELEGELEACKGRQEQSEAGESAALVRQLRRRIQQLTRGG